MTGHEGLAFHLPFVHEADRALKMGEAVASAARTAGVRRAVFNTSCYVDDHDIGIGAHDGRRAIEAVMRESGVAFTSIRPMVFMDNLGRPWLKPAIVRDGVFAYPASRELRIAWIAIADIAAAMTTALARDDLAGAHIRLGGPEALVGDEVAARLEAAIGRPVRFSSIAPQQFADEMVKLVGRHGPLASRLPYDGMAKLYAWYNAQPASPLVPPKDAVLSATTTLEAWARQQVWN
jgi:uncharacterized protein YbjT (DUF2867 family)